MRSNRITLGLLICLVIPIPALGQGFSFQAYYSPEYYGKSGEKGHTQNWAIHQAIDGLIHVGNGNGVNTFSGVEWHFNHVGESGRGLSIYNSSGGQIYIGGSTNFGRLVPDSLNRITYESISNDFFSPNEEHPVTWNIYEMDGNIYFRHLNGIGVYDPSKNTFSDFPASEKIGKGCFLMGNTIITDGKSGLWVFEDSTYSLISGSEMFKEQILHFGVELPGSNYLLGSVNEGGTQSNLWIFDGEKIRAFRNEASSYLKDKLLFDAILIDEHTIAVATLYGGVIFMNTNGDLLQVFNESAGLHTNSVFDLFLDNEKTLWMGLAEGIQKLQIDDHIQIYSEWAGIEGDVTDIAVADESMFVFAHPNIYRMEVTEPENIPSFYSIDYQGQIGGFVSFKNRIYMYDNSGLYELGSDGSLTKIYDGVILEHIEEAKPGESISFITPRHLLTYDSDTFNKESIVLEDEIGYAVKYDNQVFVTIGDKSGGTGIAKIQDGTLHTIPVEFDSSNMIRIIELGILNGKLYAGTEGAGVNPGLYEYMPNDQNFRKSKFLSDHPDFKNKQVYDFNQCSNGEIWFTANKKTLRVKQNQGKWVVHESPYQQISRNTNYTMHCTNNGVWLGSTNKVTFISDEEWDYEYDFHTNITGVYIRNDSLIFGGYGEPKEPVILPYSDNELRFSYAAASYISPEENTYQVKLEGFDEDWSDWTSETQKDYTNIPEGEYEFSVRSKNVYDEAGMVDSFSFTVLPPWYRTWWAYLLYTVAIVCVLYMAYKIRINQLLRVQRIRNNIASDLHDEVSATLSSISFFAEAIKSDRVKEDKSRFVDLIANSAGDAKEKITDIVWAINPEHDDWPDFLSKCRRFASDLLESKNMKYSLKIDEYIPGKLDMQLRQHLWLIFKEMVTNAVRHSKATQLDVIIKYEGGDIKVVVQDDGQGLDIDRVKKGNGLVNIHKRAEQINGEISLKTSEGFGTRWVLNVPI